MITLTPAAASKVKQLLETENATDLALRVAVRPGGCSGYSYEMYFDGDFTTEDKVESFGDVKVVVNRKRCGECFTQRHFVHWAEFRLTRADRRHTASIRKRWCVERWHRLTDIGNRRR
ncbi:MAG: iron-sulfur cluster assembly accessory protein [Actinobacteria bacterium]|nr:iron-sulfur cluster assembly accessory protein [Actinomycetota bacterium]